jgi:hypothetical protein
LHLGRDPSPIKINLTLFCDVGRADLSVSQLGAITAEVEDRRLGLLVFEMDARGQKCLISLGAAAAMLPNSPAFAREL